MAQSLRYIKNRISSIGNTKKVTRAMQMISAVKLSRVDNILYAARPYYLKLESFLGNLTCGMEQDENIFFRSNTDNDKITICLITSDTGLCGVYNINMMRFLEEFISAKGKDKIKLAVVGRRGLQYFQKQGIEVVDSCLDLKGKYSEELSDKIANTLIDLFLSGKAGQVYIAYTHYKSALVHTPKILKFLNIERGNVKNFEYIAEPSRGRILEEFIPKYLSMKVRYTMLESFVSEHASRMFAMKTATDNAEELLLDLTMLRNKIRQASITQDMMEIITSSEALKG